MKLPQNLGRIDRALYVVVGIATVVVAVVGLVSASWRIGLGLFGALIALEGGVGF